MRAAIGSQCKLMNRGVTCNLFSSLKISIAAVFWINCKGLIELAVFGASVQVWMKTTSVCRTFK